MPATDKVKHKAAELAGLFCLIFGNHHGLSDDLAVYLKSAGASIKQVRDLAAAREYIKNLESGLWLIVVDAGHEEPPVEELRAAFSERSKSLRSSLEPHFIIIKRGRRRQARVEDIDIVTLDGDVMYRQSLIRALAIAAGRIEPDEEEPSFADTVIKSKPESLSREEALKQGKLILVAEDNEINQKVIRQQLTLLGYAADIANDGREALGRWQNCNYGLLLTDLHMPEIDGFELTKNIRELESDDQHIPIIALTANALKGEREHCLSAGMDDYLSKPVQLEDLQAALERYLQINDSGSEEETQTDEKAAALPTPPADDTESAAKVPVDVHILEELIGDDPETIKEMLQDFRTNTAKSAAELRTSYQKGQLTTAGSIAHKLKSSSRSVGALSLGELCAEMEQAGKKNDQQALDALLPKFDAELKKVEAHLDTLCTPEASIDQHRS